MRKSALCLALIAGCVGATPPCAAADRAVMNVHYEITELRCATAVTQFSPTGGARETRDDKAGPTPSDFSSYDESVECHVDNPGDPIVGPVFARSSVRQTTHVSVLPDSVTVESSATGVAMETRLPRTQGSFGVLATARTSFELTFDNTERCNYTLRGSLSARADDPRDGVPVVSVFLGGNDVNGAFFVSASPGGPAGPDVSVSKTGVFEPGTVILRFVTVGGPSDRFINATEGHASWHMSFSLSGCGADAPVIFVPGFLASKLGCATGSGVQELWPNIPSPKLGAMELAADGHTEAGDGTCTGPVQTTGLVETAAGQDIHKSTLQFLQRAAPGTFSVFAWDWRQSPQQALAGLDQLVDQVRSQNEGRRVAILAHSFGGLLTRLYLDDPARAAKVRRALFVATPSWGSPKALFPLATGQETPAGLVGLDVFLINGDLKSFARNLAGAYFLYPSAHYGPWLTVQGRVPAVLDTEEKLVDYVDNDLLGNGSLLRDGLDAHADVLDGWKTNGVDVRAIVGTGLNTVVGVDFIPASFSGATHDQAKLRFDNGDETVPARSATQGTPGTNDPLGENIPIRYMCGVSHIPLAGAIALTNAGAAGFLVTGDELSAPDQPCSNGGFSVEAFDVDLTPVARGAQRSRVAGARQTVSEAEAAGDIDVIRFPGVIFVVTNDRHPVQLAFPSSSAHLVVRRLDGETEGPPQTFDAQPEGLQLDTTAGGTIEVVPLTPPTTTTTTLPPCTTARCILETALQTGPCLAEVVPSGVVGNAERAATALEAAAQTSERRAKRLKQHAQRLLKSVGRAAVRNAKGRHPKLSPTCAAAIEAAAARVRGQ